jgi:integrase
VTLKHFARWVNDQPGSILNAVGLPTRGIKELVVDEPGCKKLERRDIHRLFKAADRLVLTELRDNRRPRHNRAILALLYYARLRVSELVALRRDQYAGRYLLNAKRKGLYISADCRVLLDDYLAEERPRDVASADVAVGALMVPQGASKPLSRRTVAVVLDHIAQEANKDSGAQPMHLHPHRLRHTFGAEYRVRTDSDTDPSGVAAQPRGMSLLGHAADCESTRRGWTLRRGQSRPRTSRLPALQSSELAARGGEIRRASRCGRFPGPLLYLVSLLPPRAESPARHSSLPVEWSVLPTARTAPSAHHLLKTHRSKNTKWVNAR